MNFFSLVTVELKKIKRSKILLILLVPVVMMWIPSVINSDFTFDTGGNSHHSRKQFLYSGLYGNGLVHDPRLTGHLLGTAHPD